MKQVSVNVDLTVVFVIIINVRMMINGGVNGKNWLIKVYAIKDLFGMLVIVIVNVIHPVILVWWSCDVENRQKKITKSLIFITLDALQLKKIDDCENIYSINPLYLLVNHASGYIVEKNWNKYLIFDESVNENKGLLKNIQMFGMKLKTKSKQ